MTTMRITERPLNRQALALEEAEGKIRLAVKEGRIAGRTQSEVKRKVDEIIREALRSITIPDLKAAALRSLIAFWKSCSRTMLRLSKTDILIFLSLAKLTQPNKKEARAEKDTVSASFFSSKLPSVSKAKKTLEELGAVTEDRNALNYANALNTYHKTYMEDIVAPVMDRMAAEKALDPDSQDYAGRRQTLRARAELEVRYDNTVKSIADMRFKGVKLVVVSAHANCSERCRPWQGRVYSLDGTYGTAPDGRKYVPLEEATDIYTKNGKWKNGLFGFNCRHYLVPYKDGLRFTMPSASVEDKEYKVDVRQRQLERRVYDYKVKAEMEKGVDEDKYKHYRRKAREWDKYYRDFCKKNGRVALPSRTRVL